MATGIIARKGAGAKRAENAHGIGDSIRHLQKVYALLVCMQYTANYDDVEVDISDALAAVLVMVEQVLTGLDRLEAAP